MKKKKPKPDKVLPAAPATGIPATTEEVLSILGRRVAIMPGSGVCIADSVAVQDAGFEFRAAGRVLLSKKVEGYWRGLQGQSEFHLFDEYIKRESSGKSNLDERLTLYKELANIERQIEDLDETDLVLIARALAKKIVVYCPAKTREQDPVFLVFTGALPTSSSFLKENSIIRWSMPEFISQYRGKGINGNEIMLFAETSGGKSHFNALLPDTRSIQSGNYYVLESELTAEKEILSQSKFSGSLMRRKKVYEDSSSMFDPEEFESIMRLISDMEESDVTPTEEMPVVRKEQVKPSQRVGRKGKKTQGEKRREKKEEEELLAKKKAEEERKEREREFRAEQDRIKRESRELARKLELMERDKQLAIKKREENVKDRGEVSKPSENKDLSMKSAAHQNAAINKISETGKKEGKKRNKQVDLTGNEYEAKGGSHNETSATIGRDRKDTQETIEEYTEYPGLESEESPISLKKPEEQRQQSEQKSTPLVVSVPVLEESMQKMTLSAPCSEEAHSESDGVSTPQVKSQESDKGEEQKLNDAAAMKKADKKKAKKERQKNRKIKKYRHQILDLQSLPENAVFEEEMVFEQVSLGDQLLDAVTQAHEMLKTAVNPKEVSLLLFYISDILHLKDSTYWEQNLPADFINKLDSLVSHVIRRFKSDPLVSVHLWLQLDLRKTVTGKITLPGGGRVVCRGVARVSESYSGNTADFARIREKALDALSSNVMDIGEELSIKSLYEYLGIGHEWIKLIENIRSSATKSGVFSESTSRWLPVYSLSSIRATGVNVDLYTPDGKNSVSLSLISLNRKKLSIESIKKNQAVIVYYDGPGVRIKTGTDSQVASASTGKRKKNKTEVAESSSVVNVNVSQETGVPSGADETADTRSLSSEYTTPASSQSPAEPAEPAFVETHEIEGMDIERDVENFRNASEKLSMAVQQLTKAAERNPVIQAVMKSEGVSSLPELYGLPLESLPAKEINKAATLPSVGDALAEIQELDAQFEKIIATQEKRLSELVADIASIPKKEEVGKEKPVNSITELTGTPPYEGSVVKPKNRLAIYQMKERRAIAEKCLWKALKKMQPKIVNYRPTGREVLRLQWHFSRNFDSSYDQMLIRELEIASDWGNGLADIILALAFSSSADSQSKLMLRQVGKDRAIKVVKHLRRAAMKGQIQAFYWLAQLMADSIGWADAAGLYLLASNGLSSGVAPVAMQVELMSNVNKLSYCTWCPESPQAADNLALADALTRSGKEKDVTKRCETIKLLTRAALGKAISTQLNESPLNEYSVRALFLGSLARQMPSCDISDLSGQLKVLSSRLSGISIRIFRKLLEGGSSLVKDFFDSNCTFKDFESRAIDSVNDISQLIELMVRAKDNWPVFEKLWDEWFFEVKKFYPASSGGKSVDEDYFEIISGTGPLLGPSSVLMALRLHEYQERLVATKSITQDELNHWIKHLLWRSVELGSADAPRLWFEWFKADDEHGMAGLAMKRYMDRLRQISVLTDKNWAVASKLINLVKMVGQDALRDEVKALTQTLDWEGMSLEKQRKIEEELGFDAVVKNIGSRIIEFVDNSPTGERGGEGLGKRIERMLRDICESPARINHHLSLVRHLPQGHLEREPAEAVLGTLFTFLADDIAGVNADEVSRHIPSGYKDQLVQALLEKAAAFGEIGAYALLARIADSQKSSGSSPPANIEPSWLENVLVPLSIAAERLKNSRLSFTQFMLSYPDYRHLSTLVRYYQNASKWSAHPGDAFSLKFDNADQLIEGKEFVVDLLRQIPAGTSGAFGTSAGGAEQHAPFSQFMNAAAMVFSPLSESGLSYMVQLKKNKQIIEAGLAMSDAVLKPEWEYLHSEMLCKYAGLEAICTGKLDCDLSQVQQAVKRYTAGDDCSVSIRLVDALFSCGDDFDAETTHRIERLVLQAFASKDIETAAQTLLPVKLLRLMPSFFQNGDRLAVIASTYMDDFEQGVPQMSRSLEKALYLYEQAAELDSDLAHKQLCDYWRDKDRDVYRDHVWKYMRLIYNHTLLSPDYFLGWIRANSKAMADSVFQEACMYFLEHLSK